MTTHYKITHHGKCWLYEYGRQQLFIVEAMPLFQKRAVEWDIFDAIPGLNLLRWPPGLRAQIVANHGRDVLDRHTRWYHWPLAGAAVAIEAMLLSVMET